MREGDLLLVSCVFQISRASLHNDFVEVDKMQVNIQGVEHDLRRIKQTYSRLFNNEDTQRVMQELETVSKHA